MNFQELSNPNAFLEGSDLWILPDRSQASWADSLDWYLNFQLLRAEQQSPRPLPETIVKISAEEDLSIEEIPANQAAPSLFVGEHYLACRYLVKLPGELDASWFSKIEKIGQDLLCKKPRIFLPKDFDRENFFQTAKQELGSFDEVSFVRA